MSNTNSRRFQTFSCPAVSHIWYRNATSLTVSDLEKNAALQADISQCTKIDWLSKAERPTKDIIGHIGDGFYGSNDPTNSVKALKKERS